MKPLHIASIAIGCFLLLCCGGAFVCGKGAFESLDQWAKEEEIFATKFLNEYGKDWDHSKVDGFIDQPSFGPDYEANMKGLDTVLKTSYGNLKEAGSHKLGHFKAGQTISGFRARSVHQFNSTFEKGTAILTITLGRQGNQTRVVGFSVSGIKPNK